MKSPNRKSDRSATHWDAAERAAVKAAIWGTPIVSMAAMRQAFFDDAEARYNDIVYWSKPADWKLQITTPNASTHYVYFNFNTQDGPIVLEVPEARDAGLFGSILDAWQVPKVDIGPEGADAGKGGKYFLAPPDYEDNIPAGYVPVFFQTFNGYAALRAIPKTSAETDVQRALALVMQLNLYSFSMAKHPPIQHFIDMSGKLFDGIVRFDDTFYETMAEILNEEPVLPRDLAMMNELHTIGIERHKDFIPDAAAKIRLLTAARETHAFFMDKAPYYGKEYWPHLRWRIPSLSGAQTAFTFETAKGLDVNERGLTYFLACGPPSKLGKATFYLCTFFDGSGRLLTGENTYRLHVPANVPAKQFWAVTVYDSETAAFIWESPRVEVNSYDRRMQRNLDGSVDLHFGPKAPPSQESNWLQTAAGRTFFAIFRFYGPDKALIDRSWELPDIQKTNVTQHLPRL
jgi:hypothetical protein